MISVLICFNFVWWGAFATSSWSQTEHIQSKSKLTSSCCFIGMESQSANTVIRTRYKKREKSTGTTKGRLVHQTLYVSSCVNRLVFLRTCQMLRSFKCICFVFLTHTRAHAFWRTFTYALFFHTSFCFIFHYRLTFNNKKEINDSA